MRKFTKRSAAIVAGGVMAVAGGTAAFAYASGWFNGNATAYAASSTIGNVTATANLGNAQANRLYPNKAVPVTTATVNNPNDYTVRVTGVTITNVTSTKSGCGVGEAKLSFIDVPTADFPTGTTANAALGSVKMGPDAEPVCAGAVFTITASLQGEIAG
ncbi:hypothetical protein [Paractinoplanes atraurantiacus]|uniref:Uncharacterized protein n=1 Tax=Paractinoplanes atraurantiacus TaxID=1036182 RepID=A0A285F7Q5_9ACTN|nr:hypothetical protein [Actinoplanes atraurantiacus]SNY06416.1 hypothetical protein SAMN05421748_101716 [Actinoplanes atraurantiacus]